uniref:Sulfotransfer_1 domain-containing protein n=1 Tax=Macrostomum lignano TaxID=282301 RepID=A0A1I8J6Q2_9PLAT
MQKMMEAHQNEWWTTMGKMQLIFRQATDRLFQEQKIDADQRHNYFMSVTERENIHGILTAENNSRHTLAFLRHLEGITLSNWRVARNFIDMNGSEVDREAQDLMDNLRDVKIPSKLRASSIIRYKQPWVDPAGIHLDTHRGERALRRRVWGHAELERQLNRFLRMRDLKMLQ